MTTATLLRRAAMKPLTAYARNNPIEWVCEEHGPQLNQLCQSECFQLLCVLSGYLSFLVDEIEGMENTGLVDWGIKCLRFDLTGDVLSVLEVFDAIEDPQHLADILPAIASYARCEDE